MNVNATILVQTINFLIVYWMLRIFLFKPLIVLIEQEKNQDYILLEIISQQKKSLEIQEKERQKNWHACQEYFMKHKPFFHQESKSLHYEKVSAVQEFELSASEIAQIVDDIQSSIEERIKHVS